MEFKIELTLDELLGLDIDVKGIIGNSSELKSRNFKFKTLTSKKNSKRNKKDDQNIVKELRSDESTN